VTRDQFYSHVGREELVRTVFQGPSPAFFLFRRIISSQVERLRACLGDRFEINFAVKANPHPDLLAFLAGLGLGADVASGGELTRALAAGFGPERIEFTGPGKSEAELSLALQAGVGAVNVESLPELEAIAGLARQKGTKARVGLRVNPASATAKAGLKMAGDTHFGLAEAQVPAALEYLRDRREVLDFAGLHVHAGSQIVKAEAVVENLGGILALARRLDSLGLLRLSRINFGGGWGINYFPGQTGLDLAEIRRGLADLLGRPEHEKLLQGVRLAVEPGRFLVGESGVYAVRILYRKRGHKTEFAVVDGGMHHHYLLAGGMGQVIRRNFEADILAREERREAPDLKLDVAGCLCTPQDVLATGLAPGREVLAGDRVVFFNSGAYGPTASPSAFLGHPPPAEVLLD